MFITRGKWTLQVLIFLVVRQLRSSRRANVRISLTPVWWSLFLFCLFCTESTYNVLNDEYILGHLKKQLVDLKPTINSAGLLRIRNAALHLQKISREVFLHGFESLQIISEFREYTGKFLLVTQKSHILLRKGTIRKATAESKHCALWQATNLKKSGKYLPFLPAKFSVPVADGWVHAPSDWHFLIIFPLHPVYSKWQLFQPF